MLARDCTNVIGIMKKNVRKKNATATMSLRIVRKTKGIARFSQYTSRGSGAHSVSHIVGFLDCWVCAQTAAAHRVLKETNAAGMIDLELLVTFSLSTDIWQLRKQIIKHILPDYTICIQTNWWSVGRLRKKNKKKITFKMLIPCNKVGFRNLNQMIGRLWCMQAV